MTEATAALAAQETASQRLSLEEKQNEEIKGDASEEQGGAGERETESAPAAAAEAASAATGEQQQQQQQHPESG